VHRMGGAFPARWLCDVTGRMGVRLVRPRPVIQQAGQQGPAHAQEYPRCDQPVLPGAHRCRVCYHRERLQGLRAVPVEVSGTGGRRPGLVYRGTGLQAADADGEVLLREWHPGSGASRHQLPPRVALGLLEGALGEDAAAFLERIPTSVPLWDERAGKLIERRAGRWPLAPAEKPGRVGWVMAGKLLARKRPSLIPVYDEIVRCAFGWPENIWTALQDALRQDDGSFRTVLEDLKKQAGVPQQVSLLRTLDVAIWMRHRPLHTGHRCTGLM
jgi:hypothetical protein